MNKEKIEALNERTKTSVPWWRRRGCFAEAARCGQDDRDRTC